MAAPGAGLTPAAPTTFLGALKQVPGQIAQQFKDPRALADMTLRAGGMLAGSLLASSGLSEEEQALLDAQTAELRQLQQTNQALFQQRLQQAQDLVGQSKYFDPEYFGLQSARTAQTRGAAEKRAGLRGLTGERRAGESRRYDIASGRTTGTAYDQGYFGAIGPRMQTMQAGMGMMPMSAPSASTEYSTRQAANDAARLRSREQSKDISSLFGTIAGSAASQSRG
jgi:hypothetical protein